MEPDVAAILAIIAGGALGGGVRGWVCARLAGPGGVLAVNASGSLALGVLAATAAPGSALWLFLATGVLGAFTTVSSVALHSVQMWQAGARGRAVANVAGSVGLALGAVALGLRLGAA